MRRLSVLLFLASCSAISATAQENGVGTSTFTFGVGGAWSVGLRPYGQIGGPVLNGTYEFRIWKFLALEAGVHNTLIQTTQYASISTPAEIIPNTFLNSTSFLNIQGPARNTSIMFGPRAILPVKKGKVELFVGADSAYIWNADQGYYLSRGYSGWGAAARAGARFSIDKKRHVWLGTTCEYIYEMGLFSQNSISATADLSYRFGK
jgi:hypothetical protein